MYQKQSANVSIVLSSKEMSTTGTSEKCIKHRTSGRKKHST